MRLGEGSDGASSPPWWRSGSVIVIGGLLLVAGFYLATEHTEHFWGALPFFLIPACLLMHVFHHHGDGKHHAGLPSARHGSGMKQGGNHD